LDRPTTYVLRHRRDRSCADCTALTSPSSPIDFRVARPQGDAECNRDLGARIRRGQRNEFLNVGSVGEARFTTSVAASRSFAHRNISVAKAGNHGTCFSPCAHCVISHCGQAHAIGLFQGASVSDAFGLRFGEIMRPVRASWFHSVVSLEQRCDRSLQQHHNAH
jgi:hypothetical protein